MKKMKTLLILSLILVCSSVTFGQSFEPLYLTKLNSTLYKIQSEKDPRSTNMLVSYGEDGLLLVDTGYRSEAEKYKQILRSITGGAAVPKLIISTHLHGDHNGGNDIFDNEPLIMAHVNERRDYDEGRYMTRGLSPRSKPDIAISAPTSIYFNGEEIKIIPITGSHSDSDMFVYFTKSKVVAMGDVGYGMGYPTYDLLNGNSAIWGKVIQDVLDNTEEGVTYISGHGRDVNREEMKEFEKMLSATAKIVKDEMDKGKDLETIIKDNDLAEWKTFEGGYGSKEGYIGGLFNSYKHPERAMSIFPYLYKIYNEDGIKKTIDELQILHKSGEHEFILNYHLSMFFNKIIRDEKYEDSLLFMEVVERDFTEHYPLWATYATFGDIHKKMNNYEGAKKYYEKSLKLEEMKQIRKKLDELIELMKK